MPDKLTHDEACARAERRGFTLISDYVNMSTLVTFVCGKGHVWSTKPQNVICNDHGCPHCAGVARLSQEVINERLSAAGSSTRMVSPYVNSVTKSLFMCENGHTWASKVSLILQGGHGCPHCRDAAVRWTKTEINDVLRARGIELVGEYRTTNHHSTFKCAKGHVWDALPISVLSGVGCAQCAEFGFKPEKPAHFYVLRIFNDTCSRIGFGITGNIKIRLKSHKCALLKHGYSLEVIDVYDFSYGADARGMEKYIKERLPIRGIDVTGFRHEAIAVSNYPYMQQLMRCWLEDRHSMDSELAVLDAIVASPSSDPVTGT